ncbi:hypothetical protein MNEG_6673 [Monoraphidium neglectum]|uniref:Uncharacterized protein n=1 Tax=Monoraphidium neglectum TaxID=145388 RepID=A0A0D2JQD5_9CHLO|nr:hypothetical protein MNEG_6673 [Monoraphidium neglectum]KIZ01288.1 hypothetical protein MNEG_6673 [Monoraphidium neglectum]|eukprot:XP_013900307.1 hypothetical protein MNEG_6673 [Monoraphidium neglectum]
MASCASISVSSSYGRCSLNARAQPRVQATIRREESLLLNLWTNAAFQGGMAFVAVVVFAAFIWTAGPPPIDDRCTLPWC